MKQQSGMRLTGLRAWWVQRVSAVSMLLFVFFLLYSVGVHPMHTHSQWREWVAQPAITLAFGLFFAALLAHMWVGLRDVLLDYARPASLRSACLVLVAVGLLTLAIWLLWVLLQLQA